MVSLCIGAGGPMLDHKKKLLPLLQGALTHKSHKLLLYGTGWGGVESMTSSWQGVLPRYELSIW